MSKSQQIREALASGPLPLSTLADAIHCISRKKLVDLLSYLQARGDVKIDRSGEEPVISLGSRAGTKATRKTAKKNRAPKRPFKKIADRVGATRHPSPITRHQDSLDKLARENFYAAAIDLGRAVIEQVDGLDKNPVLGSALANLDRAGKIYTAARAA